ncbi:lysozyme family protein [Sphingobium sp. JAI105]|uniref:glycoside hydrolase family 108 protein n=1 Tax=Sphingobium sp. JAI105 TaxID=2787715 RepID=UPI0018CA611A|nr:N-acetylmuramidase [Sphingobium sp. JAI105]MBG6116804.1 lysozyme family protein [Sphingobium sp. JAI105]
MSKLKLVVAASAVTLALIPPAAIEIIKPTIALEGGYVNHPNDPGGETNMGVTRKVAVEHGYTGPMKALPRDVAVSIYYQSYLVKPGYVPLIALDPAVTTELFDTSVNMGPARPSRFFQQSLNEICPALKLKVDGQVGPATVAGYARCQQTLLCQAMLPRLDAKQLAEYDRLIRANPKLKVFRKGWVNHRIGNVSMEKCA